MVNDVLLAVNKLSFVRAWKNIVGVFETHGRVVKVGVVGSGDINGILTIKSGLGLRLEIEIKTGNAVQSNEQKNYQKMIVSRGGLYIVARSIFDAVDFCERQHERTS